MRVRTSAGLVLASLAAAVIVFAAEPHAADGESAAGQPVVVVIEGDEPSLWDCPWASAAPDIL